MNHPEVDDVKDLEPKAATLKALKAEIVRARTKFPTNRSLFLALVEEVGELAKADLECEPIERLQAEALQVACVAIRIYEEAEGAGEPADFEDNDPDGDHATEELRGPMVASTTHEEGFKPC